MTRMNDGETASPRCCHDSSVGTLVISSLNAGCQVPLIFRTKESIQIQNEWIDQWQRKLLLLLLLQHHQRDDKKRNQPQWPNAGTRDCFWISPRFNAAFFPQYVVCEQEESEPRASNGDKRNPWKSCGDCQALPRRFGSTNWSPAIFANVTVPHKQSLDILCFISALLHHIDKFKFKNGHEEPSYQLNAPSKGAQVTGILRLAVAVNLDSSHLPTKYRTEWATHNAQQYQAVLIDQSLSV